MIDTYLKPPNQLTDEVLVDSNAKSAKEIRFRNISAILNKVAKYLIVSGIIAATLQLPLYFDQYNKIFLQQLDAFDYRMLLAPLILALTAISGYVLSDLAYTADEKRRNVEIEERTIYGNMFTLSGNQNLTMRLEVLSKSRNTPYRLIDELRDNHTFN